MKKALLVSTGIVLGGILLNSHSAQALFGAGDVVFDPTVNGAVTLLQTAVTNAISSMANNIVSRITGLETSVTTMLHQGFTQTANYAKAQIGAQEGIADATNTAMARFQRDMRNAQIRDEHVATPAACQALDGGQAINTAAGQSGQVSAALESYTDPRGEAAPGTPAWEGQGQAMQAITQLHMSRYCSRAESQAGLCPSSQRENADQRMSSLFGLSSYAGQDDINAATDYTTNLVQPVPLAALRGEQLTSAAGQDAQARRRGYNAAMSLARGVISEIVASRVQAVRLTSTQQQQLRNLGLPSAEYASWYGVMELEVTRRTGDVAWAAGLQSMTPKSVLVEIAQQQAITNSMLLQQFRVGQQRAALEAALLSATVQSGQRPPITMPIPQVASSQ